MPPNAVKREHGIEAWQNTQDFNRKSGEYPFPPLRGDGAGEVITVFDEFVAGEKTREDSQLPSTAKTTSAAITRVRLVVTSASPRRKGR